jgi:hypothetical protein
LRQEKTIWASLDMHAQEVVKLSQILHGELRLQSSDDAVQENHGGGCQNNVVDVEQEVGGVRAPSQDE